MFSFTKTDQLRVYWAGGGGGGEEIRNNKVKRGYNFALKYVEHTFSRPKL